MSDQSFFPGLYPANYKTNPRAARIVSDLINLNYLPDPLPDGLPKPWLVAIQAIAHVRHTDHNTRWQAFVDSTKPYPLAMIDEVNNVRHALQRGFQSPHRPSPLAGCRPDHYRCPRRSHARLRKRRRLRARCSLQSAPPGRSFPRRGLGPPSHQPPRPLPRLLSDQRLRGPHARHRFFSNRFLHRIPRPESPLLRSPALRCQRRLLHHHRWQTHRPPGNRRTKARIIIGFSPLHH